MIPLFYFSTCGLFRLGVGNFLYTTKSIVMAISQYKKKLAAVRNGIRKISMIIDRTVGRVTVYADNIHICRYVREIGALLFIKYPIRDRKVIPTNFNPVEKI